MFPKFTNTKISNSYFSSPKGAFQIRNPIPGVNPHLGGYNFTPTPSKFSLNSSSTVKAIILEFCSIQ